VRNRVSEAAQAVAAAGVEALFQLFRARDPGALWPSDRSEVSSFGQREWKQWALARRAIGESAHSLRPTGAYPSEPGAFRCRDREPAGE
jgi:hypothetical protein